MAIDFADELFQLSFILQGRLATIAAAHDLSIAQVRLLGILRDREPGMLELARHLDVEKSSLSGLVDRAESRDLVERVPSDQDGRSTTIRVTARGRKLSSLVEDEIRISVEELLKPLTVADRKQLAALVARVLPAL